jgi:Spy/CpxP family protein refolding chaperone
MKKQLFSLALILSLGTSFVASAAPVVPGQDHDKISRSDHGRRGSKGNAQDRQRRQDELARDLDLNAKQKGKLEKIFQDQHQQMQALRNRKGLDRSKMMSEAQDIRKNTDKKLKSALTKAQYAKLEAKRQERHRDMGQRNNWQQNGRRDFGGQRRG